MRVPTVSIRATILFLIISANAASLLGQTLTVLKSNEKYQIDATIPQGTAYTLQGSANLHLWVDLKRDVPQVYSHTLTNDWFAAQYFRLMLTPAERPPIRVMVVGDSMAADCCGWGQGLGRFFGPDATFINYAVAYTTTKSFLHSAEYQNMQLVRPDYVLINYGAIELGPHPETSTVEEFGQNMKTIAQTVREFGGVPIIVTIHAARIWDSAGAVVPNQHPLVPKAREVAQEINTYLIDLNLLSRDLFNRLGPEGCRFMQFGNDLSDVSHVSPLGAVYLAQLVANAMPDAAGPYLTGILDSPPSP